MRVEGSLGKYDTERGTITDIYLKQPASLGGDV